MSRNKKGFTLIELLVAISLSVMVSFMVWNMMKDQKSNLVSIRQRVRTQAVAREALKTMESEIRIAGFGQKWAFLTSSGGRKDSLNGAAAATACSQIQDVGNVLFPGSSVFASDGGPGQSDILTVAYPTQVTTDTGTNCQTSITWSQYSVDGVGNLNRKTASTYSGLTNASDVVVAKGVDVFQVRFAVMGGGTTPTSFLPVGGCCNDTGQWTGNSHDLTITSNGSALSLIPISGVPTWRLYSKTARDLKAGERWRDSVVLAPNNLFFQDLVQYSTSYVTAGLYMCAGCADARMNVFTVPAVDGPLSQTTGGMTFVFDVIIPVDGTYYLGLMGNYGGTAGAKLDVKSMTAIQVGMPPGPAWWQDPSAMAASDWSKVRQIEVFVLSRAESMEKSKTSTFTGLANYVQSSGGAVGQYTASDKQDRALYDHIYPVGNNGTN